MTTVRLEEVSRGSFVFNWWGEGNMRKICPLLWGADHEVDIFSKQWVLGLFGNLNSHLEIGQDRNMSIFSMWFCYLFLQKGAGYHLDLFWVAILMVVCSFMALPWYVAATVISIAHIDSLKMETETSAPGEQPKFLGVRYVKSEENGSAKHMVPHLCVIQREWAKLEEKRLVMINLFLYLLFQKRLNFH